MKKIILVLLVTFSTTIFAQTALKEGVITTKVTMSSDNEQMKAAFAMLGDLSTTTYFKGSKGRTEMDNPMAGKTISIVDNDTKKTLTLMDNPMMGKKYIKQNIKKSEEELKDIKVTPNGETKTVVGYVCKGYDVVTKQQGVALKMKMFVTDKIVAQEQYSAALGGKIKGFPLYMIVSVNQKGMNMDTTMEVTEIKSESVDDSKFDMTVPEGYEKMEIPNAK
ncbi:MAG TPA: hypothetical protein DDZ39_12070 [Flavobacteriaceae bacterium]|jgi:hypothetical protein|nr:hypothetical protein [Flavobacteriaceae bacterium]